jgi:hypothetical protein
MTQLFRDMMPKPSPFLSGLISGIYGSLFAPVMLSLGGASVEIGNPGVRPWWGCCAGIVQCAERLGWATAKCHLLITTMNHVDVSEFSLESTTFAINL